jgi:3-phenylpropionate/trans-cinnamate dioxygenase ferredoxin subunit
MARYVVARAAEIPPGERKVLEVAGRSIGVFNVGGEYFALRNRCPHQGGPLCEGKLWGFLESSTPGDYRYSRQGEILRCPWHGWEYDLRTGQSYFDPAQVRVRSYEVRVEPGGTLAPDTAGAQPVAGQRHDEPGPQKGPYVAETYPVSVEEQYVVVEIDN